MMTVEVMEVMEVMGGGGGGGGGEEQVQKTAACSSRLHPTVCLARPPRTQSK